jgi:hypothetical protein
MGPSKMSFRRSVLFIGATASLISLLLFSRQELMGAPARHAIKPDVGPSDLLPASFYNTSSTSREVPVAGISQEQYKRVELANVKDYASLSVNNFVVTSGTIVGLKLTPDYQLILGDGKGQYLVVPIDHASEDLFGPIYAALRIGDTVEVKGIAYTTQGFLVSGPTGAAISYDGNISNAPQSGLLSLFGIRKLK